MFVIMLRVLLFLLVLMALVSPSSAIANIRLINTDLVLRVLVLLHGIVPDASNTESSHNTGSDLCSDGRSSL